MPTYIYTILTQVLELSIIITSIIGLKYKMSGGNSVNMKELIKELEQKSREIERLRVTYHAIRIRSEHYNKTRRLQK